VTPEAFHSVHAVRDAGSLSEQGWQEFLASTGVDDWVVLHGGAAAAYAVGSLTEAALLAEAVAEVPGLDGSGALLTVSDTRLTIRLTRGVMRIESHHAGLARAISDVASRHGAGNRVCVAAWPDGATQ
jgi:4a-hydroxytetrahydrobiopterin dehydratase